MPDQEHQTGSCSELGLEKAGVASQSWKELLKGSFREALMERRETSGRGSVLAEKTTSKCRKNVRKKARI